MNDLERKSRSQEVKKARKLNRPLLCWYSSHLCLAAYQKMPKHLTSAMVLGRGRCDSSVQSSSGVESGWGRSVFDVFSTFGPSLAQPLISLSVRDCMTSHLGNFSISLRTFEVIGLCTSENIGAKHGTKLDVFWGAAILDSTRIRSALSGEVLHLAANV